MTAGALPAAGCSSSGFVILNAVKNLPCARGRLAPIGATPAAGPGENAKNESSRLINSFADGSDTGAEFFVKAKGANCHSGRSESTSAARVVKQALRLSF